MRRRRAMVLHQGLMYLFHVLWELVREGLLCNMLPPWDSWPSALEPAVVLAAAPPPIQALMDMLPGHFRQRRLLWGRLAMAAIYCLTKGEGLPTDLFHSQLQVRVLLIQALQNMRHASDLIMPPTLVGRASEVIMENATLLLNLANVEPEDLVEISSESYLCYDLQALQWFLDLID